jgi:hypothetical protein
MSVPPMTMGHSLNLSSHPCVDISVTESILKIMKSTLTVSFVNKKITECTYTHINSQFLIIFFQPEEVASLSGGFLPRINKSNI